jgi:DNA ligase D-like protein (predicted 3'-phosphoesterase)
MTLSRYRAKRDLDRSPEPDGSSQKGGADRPIFVVQEHDASNLHYDFRLEIDGVLKSWAVPKGPSTDPREKRLATPTEDHPLDYADFEGVIPEGEYGAGTVLVWDTGPYENISEKDGEPIEAAEALEKGHLSVRLFGKKLEGGYTLVRMGDKADADWLLIKMRDDAADARRKPVSTEPESVLSGRTIEEIEQEAKDDG